MTKYQITNDQNKTIRIEKPGEYLIEMVEEGAEVEVVGVWGVGHKKLQATSYKLQEKNEDGTTISKKQQKHRINEDELNVSVVVVHKAPHTKAKVTLKAAGFGKAKIKLVGKLVVEPGCPGVNSFLEERVLLVSPDARAEALPELEIESDDVKCSHAATVSRIPKEQLFYLMSRGVEKSVAEEMIVDGFLGE